MITHWTNLHRCRRRNRRLLHAVMIIEYEQTACDLAVPPWPVLIVAKSVVHEHEAFAGLDILLHSGTDIFGPIRLVVQEKDAEYRSLAGHERTNTSVNGGTRLPRHIRWIILRKDGRSVAARARSGPACRSRSTVTPDAGGAPADRGPGASAEAKLLGRS